MKVIREFTRKDGVRTIAVQLAAGEKLMAFRDESFYRLGGQVDDVVESHVITESERVMWCSIEQRWVA